MGDLFMSLIHTCELNHVNPFDYLTELQRHAGELKQTPSDWMPWNYRETRSEEHTSELQSLRHLVCRLLLEKKKKKLTRAGTTQMTLQLVFGLSCSCS